MHASYPAPALPAVRAPLGTQDWLLLASKRMAKVEYALLLATFSLVLLFGLEIGISVGIVLAALHFAYRCARQPTALPGILACALRPHGFLQGCFSWGPWALDNWGPACAAGAAAMAPRALRGLRWRSPHPPSLQLLARPHDCQHRGALPQQRG